MADMTKKLIRIDSDQHAALLAVLKQAADLRIQEPVMIAGLYLIAGWQIPPDIAKTLEDAGWVLPTVPSATEAPAVQHVSIDTDALGEAIGRSFGEQLAMLLAANAVNPTMRPEARAPTFNEPPEPDASSGLDMTRRRKAGSAPRLDAPPPRVDEPRMNAADAARTLWTSAADFESDFRRGD